MERIPAEPTFIDLAIAGLGSPRAAEFFQRCDKLIPFDTLAASVANTTPSSIHRTFAIRAATVRSVFTADYTKRSLTVASLMSDVQ